MANRPRRAGGRVYLILSELCRIAIDYFYYLALNLVRYFEYTLTSQWLCRGVWIAIYKKTPVPLLCSEFLRSLVRHHALLLTNLDPL